MSGDDRNYLDREKKSFSERDRLRRERRGSDERPPGSPHARARSEAAAQQYLRAIDGVFSGGGKHEAAKLATAMREAQGTPGFADACRAYHAAAGLPDTAPLVSLFLDAGEPEVTLLGLQALREGLAGGGLKPTGSVRSQLRMLAEDADDRVAEAAAELLAAL